MTIHTENYERETHKENLKQLKSALEQSRSIVNKLNKENTELKNTIEKLSAFLGQEKKKN